MKLLKGNGRVVEVWDLGELVFKLTAGDAPIKCNGWQILEDEHAKEFLRGLLRDGAKGIKVNKSKSG